MNERTYTTPLGKIHYWVHLISPNAITLVFLPGLTADHRLFDKQIVYFEGKYNILFYRLLAEAVEKDMPYEIKCSALLICGEQDKAGSCVRYNKVWHKKYGHTAGMDQRRRA